MRPLAGCVPGLMMAKRPKGKSLVNDRDMALKGVMGVVEFQREVMRRSPRRGDGITLEQAWMATPMVDLLRLMVERGVTAEMLLQQMEAEREDA